jgi:hypothetical protein
MVKRKSGLAHLLQQTWRLTENICSGDPAAIAGYMGKREVMDDAIASFATTYVAQTVIDHAALVRAKTIRDGEKLKLVAA